MNVLDKLISFFAPQAGLHRAMARQTIAMLGTYAAADTGRRNRDWKAPLGSADLATIPDARILIPRARQLARDSWVAQSAINCVSRNIVGRGIVPVPVAKDVTGKELTQLNRRLERLFWEWASDPKLCDLEKRQTFWAKQQMCVEERVTVGEHFLVWSYQPGTPGVGLRLQSMEADQLYDIIQSHGENQVRGGIEINDQAAPVAYHFWTRNPYDYLFRTNYYPVRVPLERCLHYYKQQRVRQARGVSAFAPVMQRARDLSRYEDAHVWRACQEACTGLVVKSKSAPPTGGGMTPLNSFPRATGDTGSTPGGLPTYDFVPGMVVRLQPDEEATFMDPHSAGANFDPFVKMMLRGIAAGLNMSYEQLARDFTNGSYSSQRQSLLEDRRAWKQEQDAIIDTLIAPIYRLFVHCCFLEGKLDDLIPAAEYAANPSRFCDAEYIPDGFEWIDPVKDGQAAALELYWDLKTRKEVITAKGGRFRNTIDQRAEEREYAKGKGITFAEDLAAAPPPAKPGQMPGAPATPQPGATAAPPQAPQPLPAPADIEIEDDEEEPTFDDESVSGPANLPFESEPIQAVGVGFGAPSDSLGPGDIFDNPKHNPEAPPGY